MALTRKNSFNINLIQKIEESSETLIEKRSIKEIW